VPVLPLVAPMAVQFFVWYEIAGDPQRARAAVDAMMADVAQHTSGARHVEAFVATG
jgi:hypothetical protein